MLDEYLKANLANWDERVGVHVDSEFYDLAGFRAGDSSLTPIERDELGPFVQDDTTLLHLQCHIGLDTLSWARLGASVTGIDFSGPAIAEARALAKELGLSRRARFLQSDVYGLPEALDGRFDVVFTSWGALIWLGDLERWAGIVATYLKPGGILYVAEFHPYAFLLADDATPDGLRLGYPYFQRGRPSRFDEPGTYADPSAETMHNVSYEWNHGFAEIIEPLLRRGLRLDHLHEFPYTRGLQLECMERCPDGWWRIRGHHDDFPLSFSLRMTKEAER